MKIIEGLKKIKDLQRKCEDLKVKVQKHSADLNYESPLYLNQQEKIGQWTQSYLDSVKEIANLRTAIQRTNVLTEVQITLANGSTVKKSIAEWIHWRRDLSKLSEQIYSAMTDRGLKEGQIMGSNGQVMSVGIRRYYDPVTRDTQLELHRSTPSYVDAQLEIVNATTELMTAE